MSQDPSPPPLPGSTDLPNLQEKLNDFGSWLSPVLVKELRQGLRTNIFIAAFILLQVFMLLCTVTGGITNNADATNGFFWFFIILVLLVIQPLRGYSALSHEMQMNTLDLVQLARLNGWKITLGKWTAINAQSLLFVIAILPYVLIRYYIDSLDVVQELMWIGTCAIASGVLSAATIGFSVFRSVILRGILLAGLIFGSPMLAGILFESSGWLSSGSPSLNSILIVVLGLYLIIFFLCFGASRIAPLSENLATRKRLTAIVALLAAQLFHLWSDPEIIILISAIIAGLAIIDAVTEPLPLYSRVLSTFRKYPCKSFTAFFLTPGWISGLAFSFLIVSLWIIAIVISNFFDRSTTNFILDDFEFWVPVLSTLNTILFPLVFIHLFFARASSENFTFGLYFFIQLALCMLTIIAGTMADTFSYLTNDEILYLCFPIPSVILLAAIKEDIDHIAFLPLTIATTVLSIFVIYIRNRKRFAEFFAAIKFKPQPDAQPADRA